MDLQKIHTNLAVIGIVIHVLDAGGNKIAKVKKMQDKVLGERKLG